MRRGALQTRPAPADPETPATAPTTTRRRRRGGTAPWWFVVPAALLYAFVVLIPSIRGIGLAFTDWNGISPSWDWVGFRNFSRLKDTDLAREAVWHTLALAVTITVVQNLVGLLLALGVNSRIKSRNVLRVFLFAPAVLTPLVIGYLWRNLLAPDGAVNAVLGAVGLDRFERPWLGDSDTALWAIAGIVVWQFAGYSMVIFLAGLQGIPQEVYEAADLDGVGPVRRFWSIQRPLLAPAITINLMLSIIGGIKLFDQIYATTGGGPANSTHTLSTLIYRYAFQNGRFAFGIALAVALTVLVGVFALAQYTLLRRSEERAS